MTLRSFTVTDNTYSRQGENSKVTNKVSESSIFFLFLQEVSHIKKG